MRPFPYLSESTLSRRDERTYAAGSTARRRTRDIDRPWRWVPFVTHILMPGIPVSWHGEQQENNVHTWLYA